MAVDNMQPAYIRRAAQRARSVLNKYYSLTDRSYLYRIAILLHPSMRRQYLKLAHWPDDWMDTSVDLAVELYTEFYKPDGSVAPASQPVGTSQFAYSSFLTRMYSTAADKSQTPSCPVTEFVNGDQILDYRENRQPVLRHPLEWWYNQRIGGNEWEGLTQMALDVLSTPATSVDVERAFSFVGSIVSKRRHNLSPYSIQTIATLGSYSKAGLVKRGCLELPRKSNAKSKEKESEKGKEKPRPKQKPKAK